MPPYFKNKLDPWFFGEGKSTDQKMMYLFYLALHIHQLTLWYPASKMQPPGKNILKLLANFLILSYCSDAIKLSNKEAYSDLKKTMVSIKKSCGEVCNLSIKGSMYLSLNVLAII